MLLFPSPKPLWYQQEVGTSISFMLAWSLELMMLVSPDIWILGGDGYIVWPEPLTHAIVVADSTPVLMPKQD